MTYLDVETGNGQNSDRADYTGPPVTDRASDEEMRTVRLLQDRWRDGEQELLKARRHFWEHLAFFMGEQWTWWDPARNQLQALSRSYSPLGNGKARVTVNRIEPNIVNVLARMLATPLGFEVPPTDAADDVIAGAQLSNDLLEACYHDQQWGAIRYDEIFNSIMGATSAVSIEWDGRAGEKLSIDEGTGKVIGTGESRLRAHAITDFCLEPGVSNVRRARWWMFGLAMPPREAQAMYGLDWCPKPDAASLLSPLQHKILADSGRSQGHNQTLVLGCYERPNEQTPEGRYGVVINDRLVHTEKWPFPFKERLNLVTFRQEQLSGKWTGWTYMHSAIKLQAHYNLYKSLIAELMKKVGNPRMTSPHGAFEEEDFTDEPDSILFYEPSAVGGKGPEYMTPPTMPGWIAEEINDTRALLDEFMHVSQTSRGESIGDRASGQALALLSEKDDSPLGLMGNEQAEGWAEVAELVLALYSDKATETRTFSLRGPANTPQVRQFTGKMLHGQTRVYVDPDTTRPVSEAARQAFAKDLWDRKIIQDPGVYARLARVPARFMEEVIDADVAAAHYENQLLSIGQPILPRDFENHATHIAEHNRFRKSRAYRAADRMIAELIDTHIQAHETMAHEEYGRQQGRAEETPGLAAVAQGHEPPGSMIPTDFAEQQAGIGVGDPTAAAAYPGGGGPPQAGGAPLQQQLAPQQAPPPDFGPAAPAPGLTSGVT